MQTASATAMPTTATTAAAAAAAPSASPPAASADAVLRRLTEVAGKIKEGLKNLERFVTDKCRGARHPRALQAWGGWFGGGWGVQVCAVLG